MKTMAVLMLVFAVATGYATFVENDFGTMTAKAEIYNAKWFEAMLLILSLNLLINIFRFKMIQRKKALVLLFHVSFLVIAVGAEVTRYVGYEGMMHIREGGQSNIITSSETFVAMELDGSTLYSEPVFLSKLSHNSLETTLNAEGKNVEVSLVDYLPNANYEFKEGEGGEPVARVMISGPAGAKRMDLFKGEYYDAGDAVIDFGSGKSFDKPVLALYVKDGQLFMRHDVALNFLNMDDRSGGDLAPSAEEPVQTRRLHTYGSTNLVLREFYPSAVKTLVSVPARPKMERFPSALVFELRSGSETQRVTVFGNEGAVGETAYGEIAGMRVGISYGAKPIQIPFTVALTDFQLERYPGSMSPASYASEVVLIDPEMGINEPFRIYMNHVLDHRGYRFFQSSYDQDEGGTILSVNHDPGTPITYIGYLMLGIGMFGALFMPGGRFRDLMRKARNVSQAREALAAFAAVVFALGLTQPLQAAEVNPIIKTIGAFDKAHAEHFGRLIVQDSSGRMKPMDTLSMQIVNKVNRSNSIMGLTPNQIVLGMMARPEAWREIKMIRTGDKEVNKLLGLDEAEKNAAFSQFFEFADQNGGYKLGSYVEEASRKAPKDRNKFDKAVLKVDERVNIAYMVFTGELMRLWPKENDANNKWVGTVEGLQNLPQHEANAIRQLAFSYFTAIDAALENGDWSRADQALDAITAYQKDKGAAVYVDDFKRNVEIWYNHANIFERLWPLYFVVGFVLLILSFVKIIRPKFRQLERASKISLGLLVLFLIAHTIGLGMRWYISGHAPWSDGYESMIYIAWATVLAGFIFSKNSSITLAATGILTGLILFVAHLNWMDPKVTNLVPVLQSYWLSIHVSMITASYGFFGLGALLGFITLILFILKNEENTKQISLSIKELNYINEMSLMIGLALLTVGNFLGGVWANESWGRYWGWDPKETWALVTILVYAVVVHLRFIKAIYTPYLYSVISLLAFTSVLMTYFGVNYYLAGMHSYAKGDPVPVPDFVPVTYGIVFVIIALAYRKRKLAQ